MLRLGAFAPIAVVLAVAAMIDALGTDYPIILDYRNVDQAPVDQPPAPVN